MRLKLVDVNRQGWKQWKDAYNENEFIRHHVTDVLYWQIWRRLNVVDGAESRTIRGLWYHD